MPRQRHPPTVSVEPDSSADEHWWKFMPWLHGFHCPTIWTLSSPCGSFWFKRFGVVMKLVTIQGVSPCLLVEKLITAEMVPNTISSQALDQLAHPFQELENGRKWSYPLNFLLSRCLVATFFRPSLQEIYLNPTLGSSPKIY